MALDFITKLDELRELAGFPFRITSGYRCPDHNDRVSTTGRDGPHTTGRAADISVDGGKCYELLNLAIGTMTGIGVNQRGALEKRFVHLDDLERPNHPRPRVWTY